MIFRRRRVFHDVIRDVAGVEPMTSVTPMAMKMRADEVTDGGIPDDIVKNAPASEDHFFLVPKVIE